MRIIDLLNKIANKEELPQQIKIYDEKLRLNENKDNYLYEESDEYYGDEFIHWFNLNTEVEIIEDKEIIKDKEIERLNKEIIGLNNCIIEFHSEFCNKQAEINKLNNIINELEHHLYQEWLEWKDSDCESIYSRAGEDKAIYDYLQELKGSDKE